MNEADRVLLISHALSVDIPRLLAAYSPEGPSEQTASESDSDFSRRFIDELTDSRATRTLLADEIARKTQALG